MGCEEQYHPSIRRSNRPSPGKLCLFYPNPAVFSLTISTLIVRPLVAQRSRGKYILNVVLRKEARPNIVYDIGGTTTDTPSSLARIPLASHLTSLSPPHTQQKDKEGGNVVNTNIYVIYLRML